MNKKMLSLPYLFWCAAFILIPLAMVFYYGFTDKTGAFTLENILAIATPEHFKALRISILLSLIATVVCLLLAYPLAMILARMEVNTHSFIVLIFILPMWMNFLLRTYAWMTILETKSGLLNTILTSLGLSPAHIMYTQGAVILGMVYNYIPYMIMPLYTIMVRLDRRLVEAAQDLGCNTFHVFRKVIIPLSFPGITSGVTMTFVPAVSTFVISQLLGGPSNYLIGDLIESNFLSGGEYNPYYGSAISLLLMVVVFICMGIFNQFDNEEMEETLV